MYFKSEKKIYVIVGEESGENIADILLSSLKKYIKFKLYGIGGQKLENKGLKSLFPFTELSIMGLIEVIPKIPKVLLLINKTVNNIIDIKPDIVITVDAPDFSFRVLKKLKSKNRSFKTLHIVAPTVWAWKSKRAKKMSNFVDNLFVLFPFETDYFLPHHIKTTFIGHPILKDLNHKLKKVKKKNINKKIISIFPGSRKTEILRHLDLILLFLSKNNKKKDFIFLIVSVDRYYNLIFSIAQKYMQKLSIDIQKSSKSKYYAFRYSYLAIAVSGTISLELAICKIPMLVIYKLNYFTFYILKKIVKSRFISLANIILDKRTIPELIQGDFCFKVFNHEFSNLVNNSRYRNRQITMFKKLNIILKSKTKNSKPIAIHEILKLLN